MLRGQVMMMSSTEISSSCTISETAHRLPGFPWLSPSAGFRTDRPRLYVPSLNYLLVVVNT